MVTASICRRYGHGGEVHGWGLLGVVMMVPEVVVLVLVLE